MNFQFVRTTDDDTDIFQIESSGFIKNLEQKARFLKVLNILLLCVPKSAVTAFGSKQIVAMPSSVTTIPKGRVS